MIATKVTFPLRSWRSRAFTRAAWWCARLGAASGWIWSSTGEQAIYWSGRRYYILGVRRDHWRCILRYHHWPGVPIGLGACGKCIPWECCGSTDWDHAPGCPEAT